MGAADFRWDQWLGGRGQEPAPPSLRPLLHPPSGLRKLGHPHLHYHLLCIDTPLPASQVPGLTPLRVRVPVLFWGLWLWGHPGASQGVLAHPPALHSLARGLSPSSGNRTSSVRDQGTPPFQGGETEAQGGAVFRSRSPWKTPQPPDLPQGGGGGEPGRPPPGGAPGRREAVTRPGGDDAAGRAGHSWPLPERSPTPLAWVTAPAKLPDTETPRGLRVSGTILRLMGSDSSAPPPSAPFPPAAPPPSLARRPPRGPARLGRPGRCPTPSPIPPAPSSLSPPLSPSPTLAPRAQPNKSPQSLPRGLGWGPGVEKEPPSALSPQP